MKFDESKCYLGTLCNRNHQWQNSGKSLRYIKSGHCLDCRQLQNQETIELKCFICKQKFKRTKANAKRSLRVYKKAICSKECMKKHTETSIKVICATCNKKFKVIPTRYNPNKQKIFCCSWKCHVKNENKNTIKSRTGICQRCGKKFIGKISRTSFPKKFCSKQCENKNKKTREQFLKDKRDDYWKNRERYIKNAKKHGHIQTKTLSDSYIKGLIITELRRVQSKGLCTGLQIEDIPQDYIKTRRALVLLNREIKKQTQH